MRKIISGLTSLAMAASLGAGTFTAFAAAPDATTFAMSLELGTKEIMPSGAEAVKSTGANSVTAAPGETVTVGLFIYNDEVTGGSYAMQIGWDCSPQLQLLPQDEDGNVARHRKSTAARNETTYRPADVFSTDFGSNYFVLNIGGVENVYANPDFALLSFEVFIPAGTPDGAYTLDFIRSETIAGQIAPAGSGSQYLNKAETGILQSFTVNVGEKAPAGDATIKIGSVEYEKRTIESVKMGIVEVPIIIHGGPLASATAQLVLPAGMTLAAQNDDPGDGDFVVGVRPAPGHESDVFQAVNSTTTGQPGFVWLSMSGADKTWSEAEDHIIGWLQVKLDPVTAGDYAIGLVNDPMVSYATNIALDDLTTAVQGGVISIVDKFVGTATFEIQQKVVTTAELEAWAITDATAFAGYSAVPVDIYIKDATVGISGLSLPIDFDDALKLPRSSVDSAILESRFTDWPVMVNTALFDGLTFAPNSALLPSNNILTPATFIWKEENDNNIDAVVGTTVTLATLVVLIPTNTPEGTKLDIGINEGYNTSAGGRTVAAMTTTTSLTDFAYVDITNIAGFIQVEGGDLPTETESEEIIPTETETETNIEVIVDYEAVFVDTFYWPQTASFNVAVVDKISGNAVTNFTLSLTPMEAFTAGAGTGLGAHYWQGTVDVTIGGETITTINMASVGLRGDINMDGDVNVADAAEAATYHIAYQFGDASPLSAFQIFLGDVTSRGNDILVINDAAIICAFFIEKQFDKDSSDDVLWARAMS